MAKSPSQRNYIALQGDKIVIGDTILSVDAIRDVAVVFYAPRRFWLLAGCALVIFLGTGVLSFGLTLMAGFINSNSAGYSTLAWLMSITFFGGSLLYFGAFILAMLAYPPEWRVAVTTSAETRIVFMDKSRWAAHDQANRIRRRLGQPTRFLFG
jgi:hypothetical protein